MSNRIGLQEPWPALVPLVRLYRYLFSKKCFGFCGGLAAPLILHPDRLQKPVYAPWRALATSFVRSPYCVTYPGSHNGNTALSLLEHGRFAASHIRFRGTRIASV